MFYSMSSRYRIGSGNRGINPFSSPPEARPVVTVAGKTLLVAVTMRRIALCRTACGHSRKRNRSWCGILGHPAMQHVLECLSGYLWLGARLGKEGKQSKLCSPFNFGPEPSARQPVRRLVEEMLTTWPANGWTVRTRRVRMRLLCFHFRSRRPERFGMVSGLGFSRGDFKGRCGGILSGMCQKRRIC